VRQASRALRIEIGDDGDFQPRRMRHLGEKHRAELARANQRDAHGFIGGVAGGEEGEEVHGMGSRRDWRVPDAV
jgi:hypothetical protein